MRPIRLRYLCISRAVTAIWQLWTVLGVTFLFASPALAQPLSITTAPSLTPGVAGVSYGPLAFSATGGTPPYSWGLGESILPPLMTFNNGTLAGVPTTAGNYSFSIFVTDSAANPASVFGSFSLTVAPRITTASLPTWTVNRPYPGATLTATGASGTISWSASGLPPGLNVSPAGALTGTATSAGVFNVILNALDPSGATGSVILPLTINPTPVINDTTPLPSAYRATPYSYQFGLPPVTGGTAPYTWTNLNPLPAGLTLSAGGILSGSPINTGLFTFAIQVTDTAGATSARTFALVVATLPVVVTVVSAPPATTVGIPYPPPNGPPQPYFVATAGTGSYTWSATGLPPGIGIDPFYAFLTGTPVNAGVFNASIRATDPLNGTDAKPVTIVVNPLPAISVVPLQPCTAGTLCTRSLSVTGGTGAFTWQLISGTPPAGMSLAASGVLSGTPSAVATPTPVSFTVKATDSVGASDTNTVSIVINPSIAIAPATLPDAASGSPYSQSLTATGGTGAITWSGTGLPAWLSISAAGVLSGSAPAVASATIFNFTIRATDSLNAFATRPYSLSVNPVPVILTPSALPPWTTGRPYTATLAASGGTGALQFSDASETIPAWLSLSNAGVLTGTPPAPGAYSFTVRVTDSLGANSTKAFTLTINPVPSVTTSSLPATASGAAYSQPLTITGGTAPFTWNAAGLPAWLTLNGAVLSGTAPVVVSATVYNFSVTVTDAAGAISQPQPLSVTVNPLVTITTPNPLPPTSSGAAYSQTFTATGGTGSITWSVLNLPTWLTQSGGTLSGVAPAVNAATNYSFSVVATDSLGASDTRPFTVTVNPGITITTGAALGPWTETRPFSAALAAAGGIPAYTFADAGATLPPWLSLSAAGVVSGTPPAAGSYSFTARATDSVGATSTKQFTLTVNAVPSVNPTPLTDTTSGIAYSRSLAVNNGTAPFTWSAQNLPAWLALNGPNLTGTAPVVASPTPFSFTVTVADAAGAVSASQPFSVTVNPPVVITTTSPLPTANSGGSYSQTFVATGGTGPIVWTVANRPPWLVQNGATLSGNAPGVAGPTAYSFTVTATDAVGASNTQSFSVTVINGLTITTGAALGPWTAGQPFAATLAAASGTPPYQFSDAGATLPAWLALSPSGALNGTPPAAGVYSFTVKVTDGVSATAQKQFSLTVNAAPSITTTSLPATTSGLVYSSALAALNGTPPYTWAAINPPSWLSLSGSSLSGTAPVVATATIYSFSVTATDATGAAAPAQPLSVTVNPPVTITTSSPLASATSGSSYSQTFTAVGGTGPISWSSPDKPAWLALSGATVSGTAPVVNVATNYSFSMTATDSLGAVGTRQFSFTVSPGITITTGSTLGPWTATRPFAATLAATGGTPPYQFADAGSTLPSWLSLSAAGAVSGTPPSSGFFGFTARVTDSLGATTTKAFSLTVNPVPAVNATTVPATTSGLAVSQTLTESGGTPPFNWAAANLPAWLSLSGPTLTGTAPAVASQTTYSFTATVTDSAGAVSAPQQFSITVNPPVTILTSSLPQAAPVVPYSVLLSATGGTGNLSWSSTNLPAWLTLNGPNLGGTPPLAGGTSFNFTIRATDTLGAFGTRNFQLLIGPAGPGITTSSPLPSWTINRPYSVSLTAIGGQPPYGNWTVAAGGLPAGLQLDSASGAIQGTPTSAGSSSFTIQFTDAAAVTGSKAFQLTINPAPHITTVSLPSGAQGTLYQQALTGTGGTPPLSWSATGLSGTGLSLTAGGTLQGTPVVTSPGTISFTAILTDAAGASEQAPFSITIGPLITISTAAQLPPTTSGRQYSVSIAASGGTGVLTFSTAAGSGLPSWLTLSPQGALSGQAPGVTAPTAFTFTVSATDTLGLAVSKAFTLTVNPLPDVITNSMPAGTVGAPYSHPLLATGGTGALSWSSTGLPSWLTLNAATGRLSGTPPQSGSVAFSVIVTDSLGAASVPAQLTILVDAAGGTPSITSTCPFPVTTEGLPFANTLISSGGFPPYRWSVTGLPSWMALDPATGVLTGTASAGLFGFTFSVTDSHAQAVSLPCGIQVIPAPQVTTTTLPPGTIGARYWQTLGAFGGTGPLTWSSTNLPAWLALDSATGVLSGTPPANGTYTFAVAVTDALGAVSPSRSLALTVTSPGGIPVILSCPLPNTPAGWGISFPLTAALGFPPYSWTVSGLPAGLSAAGGIISGVPATAGTYTLNLAVTDSNAQTVSSTCFVTVLTGLTVLTQSVPDATVGAPYSQVLAASGGRGRLRWSASSLPPWLALDPSTGALSGTPQDLGTFSFSVQVTDSLGIRSPAVPLSLRVVPPGDQLLLSTGCPLPETTEGLLIATTFTARQGLPPYSWSASGLPSGLFMNPTGLLIGRAPAGTISFTVQAVDRQQQVASQACSLKINPAPAITTTGLPAGATGAPYTASLTAIGGTGRLAWSGSGLPPGIALNSDSGALSGTASFSGSATVTVRAADALGVSGARSLSIDIVSNPNPVVPVLTSACPLPGATAGVGFSYAVQAQGGVPPYRYFVSNLPPGLTFDPATGALGGVAVTSSSAPILIQVIDSQMRATTATCSLPVSAAAPLRSLTANTPIGKVGVTYSGSLTVLGGVPPYRWSVQTGTLPSGVTLDPSGVLGGIPTAAGSFAFSARVIDAGGTAASLGVTIDITGSLTISTPPALPEGLGGTAYRQTLTATAASGAITWSLLSGSLPDGLSLDPATGIISGTPSHGGTFTFTIRALDASQQTSDVVFTIVVRLSPLPQITITGFPATIDPSQQLRIGLSTSAVYPLDITGTVTLSVTPDSSIGLADPQVVFASGARTIDFRIPANSSQAVFDGVPALQTGTLAATLRLDATFQAGGAEVSPPAPATASGQLARLAPVIVGTPVVVRSANGIQVSLNAYSSTRQVNSATFRFAGPAGANLQGTDITIPIQDLVGGWYANPQSQAVGSQFSYVQNFTVQGNPSQLTSVSVTISNSVGTSQTVTVSF